MIAEQLVVRRLVDRRHVGQGDGVADAGDDVLALRVLEVVAVHALVAGGRVAGEGDPGARVVAAVAEDHRLHVHGRAEVLLDPLLAAVEDGALGVPGVEDGAHGEVELLARVLRELAPGVLGDGVLERLDQLAQVVDAEVGVGLGATVLLQLVEGRGRTPRSRCRARSRRTSGAAGGRSPSRTARRWLWSARPRTDSSLRPTLRTVSIIPGIENFAPERTLTRSGSAASPSRRPIASSRPRRCSTDLTVEPLRARRPPRGRRGRPRSRS